MDPSVYFGRLRKKTFCRTPTKVVECYLRCKKKSALKTFIDKKNIMKCLSAGVVAVVASLAAPAWAQSAAAGIWSASGSAPNAPGACFLNGSSSGYGLTLFASPNAPTVFSLDINGPFVPSTPTVATFSYGAGLSQTLTGRFISPTDLRFTLDGSTQNNFATFLHGFTAGVTMSLLLGYQAVDFSLAGTSAVVGSLGQCTDAANFNSLPAPWRPASEQPTPTPIYVATPVPAAPASTYVAAPTYVAPVSVTPPAPSYAHTWYLLDVQDATCSLAQEGDSPNNAVSYVRSENFVPNIAVNKNDDGSVASVDIAYTGNNSQQVHILFFTSLNGCQSQLNAEIQNGEITPPSELN